MIRGKKQKQKTSRINWIYSWTEPHIQKGRQCGCAVNLHFGISAIEQYLVCKKLNQIGVSVLEIIEVLQIRFFLC